MIYAIEPSGTVYKYSGIAQGKGKGLIKTGLERLDKDLTCMESLPKITKILLMSNEESDSDRGILEIVLMREGNNYKFERLPIEEINKLIQEAKSDIERDQS